MIKPECLNSKFDEEWKPWKNVIGQNGMSQG